MKTISLLVVVVLASSVFAEEKVDPTAPYGKPAVVEPAETLAKAEKLLKALHQEVEQVEKAKAEIKARFQASEEAQPDRWVKAKTERWIAVGERQELPTFPEVRDLAMKADGGIITVTKVSQEINGNLHGETEVITSSSGEVLIVFSNGFVSTFAAKDAKENKKVIYQFKFENGHLMMAGSGDTRLVQPAK